MQCESSPWYDGGVKPGDFVRVCVPGIPEEMGIYLENVPASEGIFDPQAKVLLNSGKFYTCHPSWLKLL